MSSEKDYGNCRGSESEYITLISSDGHEFVIKREVALASVTIKAMLTGPGQFEESQTNEINFRAIPSHILKRVCDYLLYKECYTDATCEIPEFQMNPEEALELLMAANFLDI